MKLRYQLVPNWERRPADYRHLDVAAVAVDSRDRVYLLTRHDPRVLVYEPDGTYVTAWGDGQFSNRAHGITIGPDDTVFAVDDADHTVRTFTPDGRLLLTVGTSGIPSSTGYDGTHLSSIQRGGGPFNRPTNVAVSSSGEFVVADGYGNARVHRFSPHGDPLQSWGEPGSGPGQFHLPHGIGLMPDGKILVADRENDRIQVFSSSGDYETQWTDIQRPTQVAVDTQRELIIVSELGWLPGHYSFRHGVMENRPGRVSVLDFGGDVLVRWGGGDSCAPGSFVAPHGIATDSNGDIYVAEVAWTFAGSHGLAPSDCHTFQKFTPRK